MRQLLFIVALVGAFSFTRATEAQTLKTNLVNLGSAGTLEIPTPLDWTLAHTNVGVPDHPIQVEVHAPSNSVVIRFDLRWDGFGGHPVRINPPDMNRMVSNNIVAQFMPLAVEKIVTLEKLSGPNVTGVFGRITDANWTPVLKNNYPNITDGMFRCGNIVGNFDMLTYGKDGPGFKAGLKVLEALRRQPQ